MLDVAVAFLVSLPKRAAAADHRLVFIPDNSW
jgi:hypothetical protein